MKQMWILGDSILRGVVWSQETKRYMTSTSIGLEELAGKYDLAIDNRSRFGYTIDKGEAVMHKKLAGGEACDVALIEYGGNDSDFDWVAISNAPHAPHFPKTSLSTYESTYHHMIKELKAHGTKPLLCNLVPVCSSLYLDWISRDGLSRENILSWLGDEEHIFRYQAQYSRMAEDIAREEGCMLVNLRQAFLSHSHMESLFCPDGIHPNERGQKIISSVLGQALQNLHLATG